jgi:hypothetical protein
MTISYCYDEKRKKAKATLLKSQLKKVAVEMGLEPTEYDLRFTAGGIAVWGEATLHSDTIYIQASYGCDHLTIVADSGATQAVLDELHSLAGPAAA